MHHFRLLSNREAAARSKERKALRQSELEIQVQTLYTQIAKLTAELELEKVRHIYNHILVVFLKVIRRFLLLIKACNVLLLYAERKNGGG